MASLLTQPPEHATFFQPPSPPPAPPLALAGDVFGVFLDAMLTRTMLLNSFHLLMRPILAVILPTYARIFGSPLVLRKIQGDSYLFDFMDG